MKKIYLLIGAGAIAVSANAQRSTSVHGTLTNHAVEYRANESRAVGDTIMYLSPVYYSGNGVDASFQVIGEDLDLLSSSTTNMFPDPDFGLFYSTATWDMMPWDVDSAFFYAATSWFDSPGQADNWLEMGPITMPAGAATLSWYVKNNPSYRDGYEVMMNTSGLSSGDFSDANFYSRTDIGNVFNAADTTWTQVTVNVPASYMGQTVYLAFHHNANDQDVLYLDEFLLKEATVGVHELNNDFTLSEVFPNPANTNTNFNINLKLGADVAYTITDLSGKVLVSQKELNRPAGSNRISLNTEGLANGMYYLNVSAGNTKLTKKFQVVK
jgi:hypothetical protein